MSASLQTPSCEEVPRRMMPFSICRWPNNSIQTLWASACLFSSEVKVRRQGSLPLELRLIEFGAGLSLTGPTSFQEALDSRFSSELVRTELFGGLTILAMLATACGLFGLVSYITAARTRESGVRLAIGASRLSIMRLILRDGIILTSAGVGIGLGCEFGLMRFLSGFVPGIEPLDAPASAIVALILSGVGLVASSIPAWRASRLNPIIALRNN